jgi:hypothetical protein
MILITVAPVGYRGSWSASIDDRVVCPPYSSVLLSKRTVAQRRSVSMSPCLQ